MSVEKPPAADLAWLDGGPAVIEVAAQPAPQPPKRGCGAVLALPFVWIYRIVAWVLAKVWRVIAWVFVKPWVLLKWLFVPAPPRALLDFFKHYVSLVVAVVGLIALAWAARQIVYPPLIVTVADLPEPLKKEPWLGTEMARALIHEIEKINTTVKVDKDQNFEAVLNPPNIVIKSGDVTFDFQDQLLNPLRSLLGHGRGEVHIALACRHLECARTSDDQCKQIVTEKSAQPAAGHAPPDSFLCLLATIDIRRGKASKRMPGYVPVILRNGHAFTKTTEQVANIAKAVTSVADPATAALYYQRVLQQANFLNAVSSDDAEGAGLRGAAFEAAAVAESQDAVSACWAHVVRARLAIDRREYVIAENYLKRAGDIPWWRHVLQLTLPTFCSRQIASAKLAFARRLAVRTTGFLSSTYPQHSDDTNARRGLAAFVLASQLRNDLGATKEPSWRARFENWWEGADRSESAIFVRAEIAAQVIGVTLSSTRARLCRIVADTGSQSPRTPYPTSVESAIVEAIERILSLDRFLGPLSRQAVMDFMRRLPRQKECLDQLRLVSEHLHKIHPGHPGLARQFAETTAAWALAQELSGERRSGLAQARSIYERLVDIGDNRDDVQTLGSLAFFQAGFSQDFDDDAEQNQLIMRNVQRAWRKFELEGHPADVRFHAENVLALWGALLLSSQPNSVVVSNFSQASAKQAPGVEAVKNFFDAVKIVFPSARPRSLSEAPTIKGIGPRIGCVCVLNKIAFARFGSGDFYLKTIFRWQNSPYRFSSLSLCMSDLEPDDSEPASAEGDNPAKSFIKAQKGFEAAKKLCYIPKNV